MHLAIFWMGIGIPSQMKWKYVSLQIIALCCYLSMLKSWTLSYHSSISLIFKVVFQLLNIMLNQLYLDINVNILVLSESKDVKLLRWIVCQLFKQETLQNNNNVKNKHKIIIHAIPCRITNITNHLFYHCSLQMFISLWLSVKTSISLKLWTIYILPQFTNDSWQLISLFTNLFSYTHSPLYSKICCYSSLNIFPWGNFAFKHLS